MLKPRIYKCRQDTSVCKEYILAGKHIVTHQNNDIMKVQLSIHKLYSEMLKIGQITIIWKKYIFCMIMRSNNLTNKYNDVYICVVLHRN